MSKYFVITVGIEMLHYSSVVEAHALLSQSLTFQAEVEHPLPSRPELNSCDLK